MMHDVSSGYPRRGEARQGLLSLALCLFSLFLYYATSFSLFLYHYLIWLVVVRAIYFHNFFLSHFQPPTLISPFVSFHPQPSDRDIMHLLIHTNITPENKDTVRNR